MLTLPSQNLISRRLPEMPMSSGLILGNPNTEEPKTPVWTEVQLSKEKLSLATRVVLRRKKNTSSNLNTLSLKCATLL